jgi:predicted nucleic acid-binding protein
VDESPKVLIDSSVWIDFFRGVMSAKTTMSTVIKAERVVICGVIRQEVLQGARDSRAFEKLRNQMAIWDYEAETPEDFVEAARIFAELRWKGITIPPSDCVIAALAKRTNLRVYTTDPDFDHIPHLRRFSPIQ